MLSRRSRLCDNSETNVIVTARLSYIVTLAQHKVNLGPTRDIHPILAQCLRSVNIKLANNDPTLVEYLVFAGLGLTGLPDDAANMINHPMLVYCWSTVSPAGRAFY